MTQRVAHHVVLLSGGLDSATALFSTVRRGHPVSALFVDYGQPPARSEGDAAARICEAAGVELRRVAMPSVPADPQGMYFGRNAVFVLLAAALISTRPLVVTIGLQLGPLYYYDASSRFVDDIQRVLNGYGVGSVQVSAPLEGMDKRAVLQLALSLGVDVAETYSCQRQEAPPCGECPSCLDRAVLGV